MNCTHLRHLLALTAPMLMALPLCANVVLPGGTVTPDVFTVAGNPPLLGDLTGTFSFGGGLSGTYEEVVLVDPLGITCSGCLDFAFSVTNDPASFPYSIISLNFSRYFGYTTDAGYVDQSGMPPILVQRGPAGGGVGFDYARAGAVLTPGSTSAFLVVATDATTYDTQGSLRIAAARDADPTHNIAGQITNLFEPTVQTPEPLTALFVSFGLAGLAVFRKRIG